MLTALLAADATVRAWILAHRFSLLDPLMLALSAVGRGGAIWLVLGFLLAAVHRRRTAGVWRMALAIGLAALVTDQAIKPLVGRPRPYSEVRAAPVLGDRPETTSFPSGHAANAFAGAFALTRVWPEARVALWTLAALIAFSRVYVGVHYPLDVVGGALIGFAAAYFALGGSRVAREEGA